MKHRVRPSRRRRFASRDDARLRQRLADGHRRIEALFELAPVAYLCLDRDGAIRQANRASRELFASDRPLLGRPWMEFVAARHRDLGQGLL